jgi:hypothetical protein
MEVYEIVTRGCLLSQSQPNQQTLVWRSNTVLDLFQHCQLSGDKEYASEMIDGSFLFARSFYSIHPALKGPSTAETNRRALLEDP